MSAVVHSLMKMATTVFDALQRLTVDCSDACRMCVQGRIILYFNNNKPPESRHSARLASRAGTSDSGAAQASVAVEAASTGV